MGAYGVLSLFDGCATMSAIVSENGGIIREEVVVVASQVGDYLL